MSLDAFRTTAAYYELLFDAEERLAREAPLLEEVYRRAPGNRVADIACGTGPHALFFAERGADVRAFDLSPEMIDYAVAHRPHDAIVYRQADMRETSGGPWDLVLCLGNSLSLLEDAADIVRTLEAVRGCLAENGLFLIQLLNYRRVCDGAPAHKIVRKQHGSAEVAAIKSLVSHGNHMLLSLSFYAFEGTSRTTASEAAVLYPIGLEELAALAKKAGLRVTDSWGGFDGLPYAPERSTDLIVLLRAA